MKPHFDDEGRPCLTAGHDGRADDPIYFGKLASTLNVAQILACRANRGRTQRARELRHAGMQFLISPIRDTQEATARRLKISGRRFRQILQEMRNLLDSVDSQIS